MGRVFPTPVGVFLLRSDCFYVEPGLPHARGGVSSPVEAGHVLLLSSPRPWGCFYLCKVKERLGEVFPTPVGVFPYWLPTRPAIRCLPSPRPWGCF